MKASENEIGCYENNKEIKKGGFKPIFIQGEDSINNRSNKLSSRVLLLCPTSRTQKCRIEIPPRLYRRAKRRLLENQSRRAISRSRV
jgi:hypothetical protein